MLDRTVAPPIGKVSEVKVIEAISNSSDGSVPLYYVDAGDQEVIKLEWITRSGAWFESVPGASFLASKMITEGTALHTADEIAEIFDYYGAQIESSPGFDFNSITVYVLRKNLGDILPLLTDMLLNSNFPEEEFKLQKTLKTENLRVNLEKNAYLASRKIRETIFGSRHPYGKNLEISHIENLRKEAALDFYGQYAAHQPVLVISGKVKSADLSLIQQHFSDIKINSAPFDRIDQPIHNEQELIVDKPGSLQSSIRMGRVTLTKDHPDYTGLQVVNEILGGYFGSRLMKNIREEKGFTYGIHSNVLNLQHASMLVIGTDVRRENTHETINEIRKEIEILRSVPIPEDELETVRSYMQGSFLSSINTPFSLADKFKSIHFHGLDYDFYSQYLNTINTISADKLMDLATKYLNPDEFSLVVVGGLDQ